MLTPSDFTGLYKITSNTYTDASTQLYIDKYEKKYLTDLLGVDLYDLFIADLVAGVPQTAKYLTIYNAFAFDDGVGSGCQHRSNGMLEMLKGFIYFHVMRDMLAQSTINGKIKNEFSNASQARAVETNVYDNYNEAVKTYQQIQWYIEDNLTDYPLFNGMAKGFIDWL